MKLTATIQDAAPFLPSKSEMNNIGKAAIGLAGDLWQAKFKRQHFQMEAFDIYNYKTRTRKWEAIKKRIHPEAEGRPLVFSGESERIAMSSNRVATSVKRDTGLYHADLMIGGSNLNFRAYEMTKTTPEEDAEMQDVFWRSFSEGIIASWKSHGMSSAKIELIRQSSAVA